MLLLYLNKDWKSSWIGQEFSEKQSSEKREMLNRQSHFLKKIEGVSVGLQKCYFVSQAVEQEKPHSRSSRDNCVCTERSSVTWTSEEWIIQKLKARMNIRNQGHINKSKDVSKCNVTLRIRQKGFSSKK